jgi:hypothetical protein
MKYLKLTLIAATAVFAPLKPILITTAIMILGDFITGIIASKKRGEVITSSGLRSTISKLLVYEIALMIGYLGETFMLDFLPITKMISSLIALTEMKSIYENLDSVVGGQLLASIISRLGSDNSTKNPPTLPPSL